jgi:hypothetical protein
MDSCVLCKDEDAPLYSICTCVDSNICYGCYVLSNSNKLVLCPVCRQQLQFIETCNYGKIVLKIVIYVILYLVWFLAQLICPIYSIIKYSHNNYINNIDNSENIMFTNYYFLWICLFNILFIQNFNIEYTKRIYFPENNKLFGDVIIIYKTIVITYSSIMFYFLTRYDKINYYYFLIVILPIYLGPFIFFNFINYFSRIQNYYNKIKEYNSIKNIKILF